MRRFIVRIAVLVTIVCGTIIATNYIVDPANLYGNKLVEDAINKLSSGNIIEIGSDFDEGTFQAGMIKSLKKVPDIVIIGSSQIMYADWNFKDYYVAGLTSANLGDYYSLVGLLENYEKLPKRIIFGVDPYAFMYDHTGFSHKSLQKYSEAEWKRVTGNGGNTSNKIIYNKFSELISFPYFQSSILALRSKGIEFYLSGSSKKVTISNNIEMENTSKILPNGKRIMSLLSLHSVEENDADISRDIKNKDIYNYGGQMEYLNQNNFEEFEKLIKYLQNKGVTIEIYLSSKYPDLYDYLASDYRYKAVLEVEDKVRKVLGGGYKILVHGSYNPYITGMKKEDYSDYMHLLPHSAIRDFEYILDEKANK